MKDSLNIPDLGDFEYTFTNRELEDVLGFIERRQSGIPSEEAVEDPNLPFLRPASVPVALQFQPHPNDPTPFSNIAAVACAPGEGGGAGGGATETARYIPCMFDEDDNNMSTIPLPGSMMPPGEEETVAAAAATTTQTKARSKPSSAPVAQVNKHQNAYSDTKAPISHSTVEKQRRDRINSLIDELRELVPPQQQVDKETEQTLQLNNSQGSSESRRPKHAVLSDTIALVRDLRSQLAAVHIEISQAQQAQQPGIAAATNGGSAPANGSSPSPPSEFQATGPAAVAAAAAAAVAVAAAAASPSIASAPGPEGVEIAPGEGCMYVKVHCRDRHGLLSDIVRTLKAIPLEITTAAITTTAAGNVYDVFQVVPAPGTPKASAQHIRDSVIAVMSSSAGATDRDAVSEKKRRAR